MEKEILNNEDGTLSLDVPNEKLKLIRGIEALKTVIQYDNEKDKQIHTKALKEYEQALKELESEEKK